MGAYKKQMAARVATLTAFENAAGIPDDVLVERCVLPFEIPAVNHNSQFLITKELTANDS